MREPNVTPSFPSDFEGELSRVTGTETRSHSAKSPLRYPGGKYRAVDTIRSYIPKETKKLAAPFLGGGSVELSCAAAGMKVYGADAFEPLINFWKQAKKNPVLLSKRVRDYYPLTKSKFYSLQQGYRELTDPLEKAAVFFVLNRSSFSGTTLSGGMSPGHPRFNEKAIDRLLDFKAKNLSVRCAPYQETLHRHQDKLLYLDPPYANGGKLYGDRGDMHEGFDHEELADLLKQRDNWILSYNDSAKTRKLYDQYDIKTPEWNYGMSNDKQSKEILIVNL